MEIAYQEIWYTGTVESRNPRLAGVSEGRGRFPSWAIHPQGAGLDTPAVHTK